MALKYQIESLDGLDDATKGMYTKGEKGYTLDIEGLPDNNNEGLRRKVDELLAEKKAEKQKREAAELEAKKAAEDQARKSGDVEALEKSWNEKLTKRESELTGRINSLTDSINSMTIDRAAITMANEIALPGSADLLIPHIKSRLAAEQRDNQFVTVVRDKAGKPSASTLDDLKAEFTSNLAFAPVLVGSKATGGGASGQSGGGAGQKNISLNDLDKMSAKEQAAFFKSGGNVTDQ